MHKLSVEEPSSGKKMGSSGISMPLAYELSFCSLSLRLVNIDAHSYAAQRSEIFTLWRTEHSAPDIHAQLCSAHGSNAISMMTVYRWIEQFKAGRTDVTQFDVTQVT